MAKLKPNQPWYFFNSYNTTPTVSYQSTRNLVSKMANKVTSYDTEIASAEATAERLEAYANSIAAQNQTREDVPTHTA